MKPLPPKTNRQWKRLALIKKEGEERRLFSAAFWAPWFEPGFVLFFTQPQLLRYILGLPKPLKYDVEHDYFQRPPTFGYR
jgi:hypothetical protein